MIKIDGKSLTINDVINVSRNYETVSLDENCIEKIISSRKMVEDAVNENRIIYGITTGVGELANKLISPEESEKLQLNLIRSHSTGVGEPFPEDVVRAIILLRANALCKGHSGVRLELINFLIEMLNKKVCPYIPSQGSVGASGDLAPLSHLALTVMGEGECISDNKRFRAKKALAEAGLTPLRLMAKEGLAMINGTQIMSALGCLILNDSFKLMKNAIIAGAMSLEALRGTAKAFDIKIHQLRPHPGQMLCAENIRKIIVESEIISSHKNCERVQDAYTLRCIPQVYGAIMDTIAFVRKILSVEINSATDNPLIFPEEGEVISGGNFHGEYLAFAMDYLGIAMSEIANISERTVDRLVNPHLSGLPPFLSENSGLNSGFMIAQYTAASLVSENKVLAHPASVDSISTSAGQEDHVSMGPISARHAWIIMKNVESVIAIEMLCAAQGIDFNEHRPGKGTAAAHSFIRNHISHLDEDRALYLDIENMKNLLIDGTIIKAVEDATGEIKLSEGY